MQLINCERPKNTLSSFSSSQEQPLINFPQYLSSWTPSFSIKVIYKKNFSPQILLWLPQLKTWPSNKNGKLYHNISTSSFPSRVWIINHGYSGETLNHNFSLVTGVLDMIFTYHNTKTVHSTLQGKVLPYNNIQWVTVRWEVYMCQSVYPSICWVFWHFGWFYNALWAKRILL